jgi:hypothetical protein
MTTSPVPTTRSALIASALLLTACGSSSGSGAASPEGSGGAAGSSASAGAAGTGPGGSTTAGGGAAAGKGGASSAGTGSPFNPKNLTIVDKSGTPGTGLQVVGLNVKINATINSVEVHGTVKNGGNALRCFAKVGMKLLSGGSSVFNGEGLVDAPGYVLAASDNQPMPCVAPGETSGFYTLGDVSSDKVDTVEVTFSSADFPGAFPATDYPLVSGLVMATMPLGGYGFSGSAQLGKAIHNVALTGYPRDGSGLPLGRIQSFHPATLPAGPWMFSTDVGVKAPFVDVLISIDYISGP